MSTVTNNPQSRVDYPNHDMAIDRSEVSQGGGQALQSMASMRASFTKLISQMRNMQQKLGIQQRDSVIELQQKAVEKQKAAIDKDQSAAVKKFRGAITGGAIGILGQGMQFSYSVKGGRYMNKLEQGDKFAQDKLKNPAATMKDLNKNDLAEFFQKDKSKGFMGKMKAPGDWVAGKFGSKSAASADDLQRKIKTSEMKAGSGGVVGAVGPLASVIGESVAAGDTAQAGKTRTDADRMNTVREMRKKEMDETDSMARESSQQLREAARSFNEIYNKLSAAVRF